MEIAGIGFLFLLITLLAVLYMAMKVVPPVRTIDKEDRQKKTDEGGTDDVGTDELRGDLGSGLWEIQFRTLTKIKYEEPPVNIFSDQPISQTSSWPVVRKYLVKDASGNWI